MKKYYIVKYRITDEIPGEFKEDEFRIGINLVRLEDKQYYYSINTIYRHYQGKDFFGEEECDLLYRDEVRKLKKEEIIKYKLQGKI